ncbi:MAG: demethoxyubiquinone hydroxylase family protein [Stellaceae bacterium]
MSESESGIRRLPGDPPAAEILARMIRVDHAGEYGARRIYDGQLRVLRRSPATPAIRHMAQQEERHLHAFDRLLVARQVRPTLLSPLWHAAGFALGAASAMLGERAAMACTEAVEEVIDDHYRRQIERLGTAEPELARTLAEFRGDEIEHRDTARAQGAADAPGYGAMTAAIKAGTRAAIWLSTRL